MNDRDTGYSYKGAVELTDSQGRLTVFDVAGYLYARDRNEAGWQVATALRQRIETGTPLDEDDRPAGAR